MQEMQIDCISLMAAGSCLPEIIHMMIEKDPVVKIKISPSQVEMCWANTLSVIRDSLA